MDLQETLLAAHNREQTDKIIAYIGDDEDRFGKLMELFFYGDYRTVQRASWPVGLIGEKYPDLFMPYIEKSIDIIQEPKIHDAVVRNVLRILMEMDIPEEHQSVLVEICLKFITEPNKPSAIKAFAIGVLQRICNQYPELAHEIKWILKERMEFEKPAFVSRATHFLKDIERRERKNTQRK